MASLHAAESWNQFRGPFGNGTTAAKTLPTQWSDSENVVWNCPIPGLGWSSPVMANGKVYLTTSVAIDGENERALQAAQKISLVCVDYETGKIDFVRDLIEQGKEAPSIHGKNSHASPTPIVDENRLYLHFGHQGTFCTDLMGKVVWSNREHPYPPVHGNGASPIIVDNLLIVTCDGSSDPYTLALDKMTGKEVWRTPRAVESERRFSFCTPTLIQVNGTPLVISQGSDVVQAIAPKDGSVVWQLRFEGYSVIPKPIFHRGLVYLSTGYGSTILLAIDPTGKGDVTNTHLKWKIQEPERTTDTLFSRIRGPNRHGWRQWSCYWTIC